MFSQHYQPLNSALLLWGISLTLWTCHLDLAASLIFPLVLLLLFHFFKKEINKMFGKNKVNTTAVEKVTVESAAPVVTRAIESPELSDAHQGSTVIADGVCFEGNINASGMVYIRGKVLGNIHATSSIVKIMRNGHVEGNIFAREAVIDGTHIGECHAEVIDIYENGNINGAITYQTLAIKRGGIFIGTAETRPAPVVESNVIEMNNVQDSMDNLESSEIEAFEPEDALN